jgi:MoxR-like ATPase
VSDELRATSFERRASSFELVAMGRGVIDLDVDDGDEGLGVAGKASSKLEARRSKLSSPDEVQAGLKAVGYVADRATATVALLGLKLEKPLLVEGPAGVGKTALGVAWAKALGRELIRLQCYDGLDEARALYEWSYGKQLLATQLVREMLGRELGAGSDLAEAMRRLDEEGMLDAFFSERFLVARPLLQAIRSPRPVLLLIDEIDRADEGFEALLLELLSEYQVTIPELGTLTATHLPVVVLTSNATRDLSDALKRRCLHIALDYPAPDREREIVRLAVPGIDEALTAAVVAAVARVRALDLRKRPSVGETIDWARALQAIGAGEIDRDVVAATAGVIAKYGTDAELVKGAWA